MAFEHKTQDISYSLLASGSDSVIVEVDGNTLWFEITENTGNFTLEIKGGGDKDNFDTTIFTATDVAELRNQSINCGYPYAEITITDTSSAPNAVEGVVRPFVSAGSIGAGASVGQMAFWDGAKWTPIGENFLEWDNSAHLLSAAGFSGKLYRIDTAQFEVGQLDIEYMSPNQHGFIFGTVYRVYKNIPDGTPGMSAVTVGLPFVITRVLDIGGYLHNEGDNRLLTIPHASANSGRIEFTINTARNSLDVITGPGTDHAGGYCWIDYTR